MVGPFLLPLVDRRLPPSLLPPLVLRDSRSRPDSSVCAPLGGMRKAEGGGGPRRRRRTTRRGDDEEGGRGLSSYSFSSYMTFSVPRVPPPLPPTPAKIPLPSSRPGCPGGLGTRSQEEDQEDGWRRRRFGQEGGSSPVLQLGWRCTKECGDVESWGYVLAEDKVVCQRGRLSQRPPSFPDA